MRIVIQSLCLLSMLASGLHATEIRGTPDELNLAVGPKPEQSTIVGTGEIKAQADKVTLRLRIVTEGKSLEKAVKNNNTLRQKLINKLSKAGIDKKQVAVSKFSWTPELGFFGDKVKNYKISNDIKINLVNENQFIHCAAIIDGHEEIDYAGLSYHHSNNEQLQLQALEKACQNTVEKKDVFEKTLGVKLKVVRVAEQRMQNLNAGPISAQRYNYLKQSSNSLSSAPQTMVMMDEESSTETIPFGQIIYRATVVVDYQHLP